jgi:hypothetical protein
MEKGESELAARLDKLEAAQRFGFRTLNGLIADLTRSLYRTRRDLIALAGLLSNKDIPIDAEEWEAAAKELDAARQIELALDPRFDKAEEFLRRILAGEEIPDEEMNQWLRDVQEGCA